MLAYEPPDRVVISWDINPEWQIETDLEKTSQVEVRFIAETPERTRVELEHRNLDRQLEGWEAVREGVDSEGRCTCSASPNCSTGRRLRSRLLVDSRRRDVGRSRVRRTTRNRADFRPARN